MLIVDFKEGQRNFGEIGRLGSYFPISMLLHRLTNNQHIYSNSNINY